MAIRPSNVEPQTLAAGDTISFLKKLAEYPATDGWALEYEITNDDHRYAILSVAQGASHLVNVAAAVTAAYAPGDYELQGFAVNAGSGERVQIYQAPLPITVNTPVAGEVPLTHAARMVQLIEAVMLGKATHDILESEVEGTRIKRLSALELRKEHAYWTNVRENEVDGERARDGLPSRNVIKPRFNVTKSGPLFGFEAPIFPR